MLSLFNFALKNLPRHRSRTIITISAVAFGAIAYILINSLIMGMINASLINLKKYETGHAQVLKTETFDEYKTPYFDRYFESATLIENFKKDGIDAKPRMISRGTLNFYEMDGFKLDGSLTTKMVGINTNYEDVPSLIEGDPMANFKDKAVLGIWVSRYHQDIIGADVGDILTISVQTAYKSEELLDVEVVGIYETDNGQVNASTIYFDSLEASTILEFDSPTIATNLFLDHEALPKSITIANGLTFKTYDEIAPEVVAIAEQEKKNIKILLSLIFAIIVIGISNTMMMAIFERFKEIGTLRAFGMSKSEVRILFTFEGLLIGLAGAIVGIMIASIFNIWLVEVGIQSSSNLAQTNNIGFRVNSSYKGMWHIPSFIQIIVITCGLSTVFAWLTSGNAFKKSITDCLRNI